MVQTTEIKLLPAESNDLTVIRSKAISKCKLNPKKVDQVIVLRKSIDARGRQPYFRLKVAVYLGETYSPEPALLKQFNKVDDSKKILIVGAGPAGYFAAMELIERGIKPIIFDRGKDVRSRRKDLRDIQQFGKVNANSNYCFGEGGAGTYSDGKLYTRSHKRGNIYKALKLFVEHGASSDILIDAHPHIGSNRLPNIIQNIRETIIHFGGEIHFDSSLTDFIINHNKIEGIQINQKEEYFGDAVILATGHSARDVFQLLKNRSIKIEAKPFALGIRIEHPQSLIDNIQYSQTPRDPMLPAATYKLVAQVKDRGVFSFCMCPGGLVVPAATAPGEIVVNGMSMSRRDSLYANSGIVTSIELEDLRAYKQFGEFQGLEFQKSVEQKMFDNGDGSQKAPAQRMIDFIKGKQSIDLPSASYIPGLYSAPLHQLLPAFIYKKLQAGLKIFGHKMPTYLTNEANIIGIESRTSSPIRVPRDRETLMHVHIQGLFPAGEGAGYAGGIISAALDGQNVAKAIHNFLH